MDLPLATPQSKWPRLRRALELRTTYVAISAAILLLDYATGPYLQFPILFVVPVLLAAWYHSAIVAYVLALALPVGRFFIASAVDRPGPIGYSVLNAAIRVAVLLLIAYLATRSARQTRALQDRVAGLVTVCAWSRTVEYDGAWISFEEYLQRRFHIATTHGLSPEAMRRLFRDSSTNPPATPPPDESQSG
jgi:hypothetical protein